MEFVWFSPFSQTPWTFESGRRRPRPPFGLGVGGRAAAVAPVPARAVVRVHLARAVAPAPDGNDAPSRLVPYPCVRGAQPHDAP
jgi:hypothetical protein